MDKAGRMDPIELKRAARRCLEALPVPPPVVDEHENTVLDGEERAARARIELQVWENADGTTSGRFTVDRVAGAVLRTIIDAMTAPRRVGIAAAHAGRSVSHDADERAHLAGQAFATLLERRTDLDNAVPLCNFHHQRIHDPRYNHDHRPGGAVAFHRRT